jgi:hypothetical protein
MPSTASTLTNLIPELYSALDVVSRELVGFIPSVTRDATTERAAKDQTVRSFVTPAASAGDIAPDVTPPDDGHQTIGNVSLTISKARRVPVRWQGEESRGLNSGPGRMNIMRDQFAQAFRTLTGEMETDLAALHIYASRAYGDGGTTPFASTLADSAQVRKILDDNGAPQGDRSLIIDTTSGAALRTLAQLTKTNEAGTEQTLRQGVLLDMHGFAIRESSKVKQLVTSGTAASATTDSTGYAVGATTITLASAGTGTIIPGDVIRFTGDANQYLVVTGDAAVNGGGTIVIAEPGLRVAIAASATDITVEEASTRNMAFSRSAIILATRAPALPDEGDMADDRQIITDPFTGVSFEVSVYKQYRQVQYEIAAAWGVKVIAPRHVALMLG